MKTALVAIAVLTLVAPVAFAQDANCKVDRKEFVPGRTSSATMVMTSGSTCQFRFRFGGQNAPDTWELVAPPKSGKVEFKEDIAEYRPNPDFVGSDAFAVNIFGKSPTARRDTRNGKYEISVTVSPKP